MTNDKLSSEQSPSRSRMPGFGESQRLDWVKMSLITVAIAYLALILFIPALNVFIQAFRKGVGPFFNNLFERGYFKDTAIFGKFGDSSDLRWLKNMAEGNS